MKSIKNTFIALLVVGIWTAAGMAQAESNEADQADADRASEESLQGGGESVSYVAVDSDDLSLTTQSAITEQMFNACSRLFISEVDYGNDGCGGNGTYTVGWAHYSPSGLLNFLGKNCYLCFVKDVSELSGFIDPGSVVGIGIGWSY